MTEALDHQFLQILTSSHPLRLFELKEGEEFLQYQEVMALMKVLLGTLDGKKITAESVLTKIHLVLVMALFLSNLLAWGPRCLNILENPMNVFILIY